MARRRNPIDCLDPSVDLAQVVLRPRRPHLRAAQAAQAEAEREWNLHSQTHGRGARRWTSHARFARAAWEALNARGVLPDAWLDNPRRRFAALDGALHRVPDDFEIVRAIGADPDAAAHAEFLLQEAQARLAAYGVKPLRRWTWDVVYPRQRGVAFVESKALVAALSFEGITRRYVVERTDRVAERAAMFRRAAISHQEAADAEPLLGPNPFAPIVEIFCLGYVPYGVGGTEALLVAPMAPYDPDVRPE